MSTPETGKAIDAPAVAKDPIEELREVLDYLKFSYRPDATYKGTCVFDITPSETNPHMIFYIRCDPDAPTSAGMGLPPDGKYSCYTTMSRDDFFLLYSGAASPSAVAAMCLSGRLKVKWWRYHELQQFAGAFTYSTPNWIMFYRLKGKDSLADELTKKQWEDADKAGKGTLLVDENGFIRKTETVDPDQQRIILERKKLLYPEENVTSGSSSSSSNSSNGELAIAAETIMAELTTMEAEQETTTLLPMPSTSSSIITPADAAAQRDVVVSTSIDAVAEITTEPKATMQAEIKTSDITQQQPEQKHQDEPPTSTLETEKVPTTEAPMSLPSMSPVVDSALTQESIESTGLSAAIENEPHQVYEGEVDAEEEEVQHGEEEEEADGEPENIVVNNPPSTARVLLPDVEVAAAAAAAAASAASSITPSANDAANQNNTINVDASSSETPSTYPPSKIESSSLPDTSSSSSSSASSSTPSPSPDNTSAASIPVTDISDAAISSINSTIQQSDASTVSPTPPSDNSEISATLSSAPETGGSTTTPAQDHSSTSPTTTTTTTTTSSSPTISTPLLSSPSSSSSSEPDIDLDIMMLLPSLLAQPRVKESTVSGGNNTVLIRPPRLRVVDVATTAYVPLGYSVEPLLQWAQTNIDRSTQLEGTLLKLDREKAVLEGAAEVSHLVSDATSALGTSSILPPAPLPPQPASMFGNISSVFSSATRAVTDVFNREKKLKLEGLAKERTTVLAQHAAMELATASALQQVADALEESMKMSTLGSLLATVAPLVQHNKTQRAIHKSLREAALASAVMLTPSLASSQRESNNNTHPYSGLGLLLGSSSLSSSSPLLFSSVESALPLSTANAPVHLPPGASTTLSALLAAGRQSTRPSIRSIRLVSDQISLLTAVEARSASRSIPIAVGMSNSSSVAVADSVADVVADVVVAPADDEQRTSPPSIPSEYNPTLALSTKRLLLPPTVSNVLSSLYPLLLSKQELGGAAARRKRGVGGGLTSSNNNISMNAAYSYGFFSKGVHSGYARHSVGNSTSASMIALKQRVEALRTVVSLSNKRVHGSSDGSSGTHGGGGGESAKIKHSSTPILSLTKSSSSAVTAALPFSVMNVTHSEGMGSGDIDNTSSPQVQARAKVTTMSVDSTTNSSTTSSSLNNDVDHLHHYHHHADAPLLPDGALPGSVHHPHPHPLIAKRQQKNRVDTSLSSDFVSQVQQVVSRFSRAFGHSSRIWDHLPVLAQAHDENGEGCWQFASGCAHLPLFLPVSLVPGLARRMGVNYDDQEEDEVDERSMHADGTLDVHANKMSSFHPLTITAEAYQTFRSWSAVPSTSNISLYDARDDSSSSLLLSSSSSSSGLLAPSSSSSSNNNTTTTTLPISFGRGKFPVDIVVDAPQAETFMWCMGAPISPLDRAPVTLGALELPADPAAQVGLDTGNEGSSLKNSSTLNVGLLPIWRPKRLTTTPRAIAVSIRNKTPAVYDGLGSGLFLDTSSSRLRLQFQSAIEAAAEASKMSANNNDTNHNSNNNTITEKGVVGIKGSVGSSIGLPFSWSRRGISEGGDNIVHDDGYDYDHDDEDDSFLDGRGDDSLQAAAPPRSGMTIVPPALLVEVAKSLQRQRVWKHYGRSRALDAFTADSHVDEVSVSAAGNSPSNTQ